MTEQRAVFYDRIGSPEVLRVGAAAIPTPAAGRALLAVRAAGINPYDLKVVTGAAPRDTPFPRGIGSDVCGEVVAVGEAAVYDDGSPFEVGHRVFGWGLNTMRERLVVRASSIARVPDAVSDETAAALVTPVLAAHAAWISVPVDRDDVVVVSGAAGTIGHVITQWAIATGARVLATAAPGDLDDLRGRGATALPYGDGVAQRILAELGDARPTALFDVGGRSILPEIAALGIPADRIATLAGEEAATRFGATAPDTSVRSVAPLLDAAHQVAAGTLDFPVAATHPLDDVVAAFEAVASGVGKVVLTID